MSFVPEDFAAACALTPEVEVPYELPDGSVVTVGSEAFRCAEVKGVDVA